MSEIKDDLKDAGERMKEDIKRRENKIQTQNQEQINQQKNDEREEIGVKESNLIEQSPSTEIPSDEIHTKTTFDKKDATTTTKKDNESLS